MRVLIDAAFPTSADQIPHAAPLTLERVTSAMSDRELIERAANEHIPVIVLLEPEIVSQASIRALAAKKRVTLVCSSSDDPFEAETNLRHSLTSIASQVESHRGEVLWLRKDGIHAEDQKGV